MTTDVMSVRSLWKPKNGVPETARVSVKGPPEEKLMVMSKSDPIKLFVSNPKADVGESKVMVSARGLLVPRLSRKPPVKPPPASMLKKLPTPTGVE